MFGYSLFLCVLGSDDQSCKVSEMAFTPHQTALLVEMLASGQGNRAVQPLVCS